MTIPTLREAAAGLWERARYVLDNYPVTPPEREVIVSLLAESEELRKERDEARAVVAPETLVRMTEGLFTIQNAAISVTKQLAGAEARATKAEALVAEAMEVIDHYADTFCEYSAADEVCGKFDDDTCSGCRARAFIGRVKESGNG